MITPDFETKSYADLKKVGAWAYSEHPSTEVICLCYGIDDEEIQEWWPGKNEADDMPIDLYMALRKGHSIDGRPIGDYHTVEAHYTPFEISIWHNIMAKKYGWMIPYLHSWRDTMATACYYALPAALDPLARLLGFPGKDPEGGRLITKYCKLHLKTAKLHIPDYDWVPWKKMTATEREKNPRAKEDGGYFNDDFRKMVEYCKEDVREQQAVGDYLGDLPERELLYYQADLKQNMRGLCLDLEGIAAATEVVSQRAETLTTEFRGITGLNPTQGKKLMTWFEARGLPLENLQAPYIEEILEDGELGTGSARRALEIRVAINKASTKKLDTMSRQCGSDGRVRFQTRYHGAVTGRPTGSGFQPLNLNRGFEGMDPAQLARDIMYRDAAYLDALYGDATDAVAKASRYWIKAEPGNKIIAGDYASIEAILLAWVAGEEWKIDAFRKGVKIYEHMGDKIHGLAPGTVSKSTHPAEYQDGKTGELAFGYQGALGAWLKFDNSGRHSDERIIEFCRAWRKENPAIVALWPGLENAAIQATNNPGQVTSYREIQFERVDEWLTLILPNAKRLWYWKPRLQAKMPRWHMPLTKEKCRAGTCDCRPQPQLCYQAQKTGQWQPNLSTYGGKWSENTIQAWSREIIELAGIKLVAAGYDIILKVYDEPVAEVAEDFGSTEEFKQIMIDAAQELVPDCPITASVWEGERYKK
ncbi:MAG: hypothetical protein V3V96_15570 [Acidiferrobacterales bacterium]